MPHALNKLKLIRPTVGIKTSANMYSLLYAIGYVCKAPSMLLTYQLGSLFQFRRCNTLTVRVIDKRKMVNVNL